MERIIITVAYNHDDKAGYITARNTGSEHHRVHTITLDKSMERDLGPAAVLMLIDLIERELASWIV